MGFCERDNELSGSIKRLEFLLSAERLLVSQDGLFLMELVVWRCCGDTCSLSACIILEFGIIGFLDLVHRPAF